jgi:hypothetical protein
MGALILMVACGVCLQDKVAATYDHAVVQRAAAQHRVVVFAEPRAPVEAGALAKAVGAAAARVPGVDAATVRTNASPASVSFALDPARAQPKEVLASIRKSAGVKGLELDLLEVVKSPR